MKAKSKKKIVSDFRYGSGPARVPWAAVGEVVRPAEVKQIIKVLVKPAEGRMAQYNAQAARVAREIASGETINTIAQARTLSRETVRNQLKGVLAKTGLSRQSDLAALLNGIAVPRPSQS